MQRIVIVGGGVGGTMLANLLVVRLYPEILGGEVQVLLISDSPDHYYKPAFMYVAFEQFFLEDLKRPQRSLLRPEVMFQLDRVDRFDSPPGTADPQRQAPWLRLPGDRHGLRAGSGTYRGAERAGDHFYQYQPARRLAERLASLESGRVFITVSFPGTPNVPHQCGIAPVETTLMLDDYLRRRGVRERVEIVYTYPTTAGCCATVCSCNDRPAKSCRACSSNAASVSSAVLPWPGSTRSGASPIRRRATSSRSTCSWRHRRSTPWMRSGVRPVPGRRRRRLVADEP